MANRSAVLLGYFGRGNFGDDLLLNDLTERVKPLVDEVVVVRNPQPGIAGLGLDVVEVDLRDIRSRAKVAREADLIVLGPGGILRRRHDNRMLPPLVAQAFEMWLGQILGKPTVLHNVSVDSAEPPLDVAEVIAFLERLTQLTVRDDRTAEILSTWGLERADILIAADPILSWQFTEAAAESCCDIATCMSASELRGESHGELVAAIEKGVRPRSMIYFKCTNSDPTPEGAHSTLLNAASLAHRKLDWPDLVITMRFHVAVVAFAAGRRPIGISKEVKMKALFEEYAPEDYFDRETRSVSELPGWLAERMNASRKPISVAADQTAADGALAGALREQPARQLRAGVDLTKAAVRLVAK